VKSKRLHQVRFKGFYLIILGKQSLLHVLLVVIMAMCNEVLPRAALRL